MKHQTHNACGHAITAKDRPLADLNLLLHDQAILQIMRFYMQSVAHPTSQAWMNAITCAKGTFGTVFGPQLAALILDVLQTIRVSRRSTFCFNNPSCPSCRQIVTEHERRFMHALTTTRTGATGQAQIELLMLCEGNEISPALDAMNSLNSLLASAHMADAQHPQSSPSA